MCIYWYYRLGRLANGFYNMFDPAKFGDIPAAQQEDGSKLQPWQGVTSLRLSLQTKGRFRQALYMIYCEEMIEFSNIHARIARYNSYLTELQTYISNAEIQAQIATIQASCNELLPTQHEPLWYYIWRGELELVKEHAILENPEAKLHLAAAERIINSAITTFTTKFPHLKINKDGFNLRLWDARSQVLATSESNIKIVFKEWSAFADAAYKLRHLHYFLHGLERALNNVEPPKDPLVQSGIDTYLKLYRQLEKQYNSQGNVLEILARLMGLAKVSSETWYGQDQILEILKDFHATFPEAQCWKLQIVIASNVLITAYRASDIAALAFGEMLFERCKKDEEEFWQKQNISCPEQLSYFPFDQLDNQKPPQSEVLFGFKLLENGWELYFDCLWADMQAGLLNEEYVRELLPPELCRTAGNVPLDIESLKPDNIGNYLLGQKMDDTEWLTWIAKIQDWLFKPTSWGSEHNRHLLLGFLFRARIIRQRERHERNYTELNANSYVLYNTVFVDDVYPRFCRTAQQHYDYFYCLHIEGIGDAYNFALGCHITGDVATVSDHFKKALVYYKRAMEELRKLGRLQQAGRVLRKMGLIYLFCELRGLLPSARPLSLAEAMGFLHEAEHHLFVHRSEVARLEMGIHAFESQRQLLEQEGQIFASHNTAIGILVGRHEGLRRQQERSAGADKNVGRVDENIEIQLQLWNWVQSATSRLFYELIETQQSLYLATAERAAAGSLSLGINTSRLNDLVRQRADALHALRNSKPTDRVKFRATYRKLDKQIHQATAGPKIAVEHMINPSSSQLANADPNLDAQLASTFTVNDAQRLATASGGPIVVVQWFEYYHPPVPPLNDPGVDPDERVGVEVSRNLMILAIRASPDLEGNDPAEIPTIQLLRLDHPMRQTQIVHDWATQNMESHDETQIGLHPILAESDSNAKLRKLDFLVTPLADISQRDDIFIFCPTRSLHRIPLHALQLPTKEFIIQRNPVVYCQNLSILRQSYLSYSQGRPGLSLKTDDAVSKEPVHAPATAAASLVTPTPSLNENHVTTAKVNWTASFFNDSPRCSSLGTHACLQSPCARCREILQLSSRFHPSSNMYLGPNAHKSSFFETLRRPTQIIHINLHGVFPSRPSDRTRPFSSSYGPAFRAGFLGLNDDSDPPDYLTDQLLQFPDAEVTVLELFEQPLSPHRGAPSPFHVSLISCSSARRYLDGGDNSVGLINAFFYQGATSVIAAQWNIQDEDGMDFATRFYEDEEGFLGASERGTSDGVVNLARATQRAILRMMWDEEGNLVEPYHWAGFVLHGWWIYREGQGQRT